MSSPFRVPLTMRDFFFADPFFRSTWDDFDLVRAGMAREPLDFWGAVERDMRRMDAYANMMASDNALEGGDGDKKKKEKEEEKMDTSEAKKKDASADKKKEEAPKQSGKSSKAVVPSQDDAGGLYSPWFFPRRWMAPQLFRSEETGGGGMLDLFQHKDNQVVRIKDDDAKFEVSLDVHNFRPDEVKVSVKDRVVSVEAKHEEKSEGHFESRHFQRSYLLPEACETEDLRSDLSSDGILVVSAPKKQAIKSSKVPIAIEYK